MATRAESAIAVVRTVPTTLEDALTVVHGLPDDAWAVLISPRREHAEHRRLVYQARAAREETLVAFHVTDLSPLGAAILTEMAQPLLTTLPPHRLLPALAALESQMRCFTVTDTVVSMNEPRTPLLTHARSWIPGGTYLAELGGGVHAYSPKKPGKALDRIALASPGAVAALAPSSDEGPAGSRIGAATEALIGHLRPAQVLARPNPDPGWWGSPRCAQLVLAPADLSVALKHPGDETPVPADIPVAVLCTPPAPPQEAST
ncbi:hypothetical protein GCM10027079_06580 [Sediminivirga luteola]|uniref:Uncharacterized protein n=1 Tax=Sediminivirga luteola TaxID=1774748 RepID=A0A8J2XKG6_9MICO|nr:hypothetical protein [Sediminivirga luteola]GGA13467.1 hypothetical protein GCM10011333_15560 [Sediminivirga luteola]